MIDKIETAFPLLDKAINILKEGLNTTTRSALIETFDNLLNEQVKVESGAPGPEIVEELSDLYQQINFENLTPKEKTSLFNLATLTSIKADQLDYNQQMTPKAIATTIAVLVNKFIPNLNDKIILDPAIGTGELLLDTLKQLQINSRPNNFKLVGLDNDEEFLEIADLNATLNNLPIELFHQDALEDWLGEKPDVVISDLPIGYYPNDKNAKNFDLSETIGHSLAHQLFIEQIIRNLDQDRFAFLVVPAVLLQSEIANTLIEWLTKRVHLHAIIELPEDLFGSQQMRKNIIVLQKKGQSSRQAKEILLARLGSFREKQSLIEFNYQLNEWYKNNLE